MKGHAACYRALSSQWAHSAQDDSCHFSNLELQSAGSSKFIPEEGAGAACWQEQGQTECGDLGEGEGRGQDTWPGSCLTSQQWVLEHTLDQMEMEICRFGSSVYTWTERFSSIPFPLSKVPWKELLQKYLDVAEGLITEVRNFWASGNLQWWWPCHGLEFMEHQFFSWNVFSPLEYFDFSISVGNETGFKVCFWWDVLPTSGSLWPLMSCFLLHIWI